MRSIEFHPLADRDLEDIIAYTTAHWGERQARDYANKLHEKALSLVRRGNMGARLLAPQRAGTVQDIFMFNAGMHRIFYSWQDKGVMFIIAVLHQQMNVEARIAERIRLL